MTRVRIGNCVYFDAEVQNRNLLPLLQCLRFAIDDGRAVSYFLKGILTDESGPVGGDPGWAIDWIPEAEEALYPDDWRKCMEQQPRTATGCYEAWMDPLTSDLNPSCCYYPASVVRHHVHEVLGNFRALHPDRAAEVDAAIKRFHLEKA